MTSQNILVTTWDEVIILKVRHDFVTNSSSSSFIIAKHKDCTLEEIKERLYAIRNEVEDLLDVYEGDLCADGKPIRETYDKGDINKAVELAIDEIAYNLMWCDGLTLDNWNVESAYASNEDNELFPAALYNFGGLMATEHLKLLED